MHVFFWPLFVVSLSSWTGTLTGGECAQPCRWGIPFSRRKTPRPVFSDFEDEKGSYILNAKDLCLIEYIDQLAQAGVTSLKIEGRAKSSYYVSVITNAYRIALDQYQRIQNISSWNLGCWMRFAK